MIAVAVLLASVGIGLYVRNLAGGMRNAVSASYWAARMKTEDLYAPATRVLKHGNRSLKEIALTLDDGPKPQFAPRVLDILHKHGIRATFFLVGKCMQQYPELVRRVIAEGHEVGNHTQNHLRLDTLPLDKVRQEIVLCDDNFAKATTKHLFLLRPPGVRYNPKVLSVIAELGYTTVAWSVGAKDAEPSTPEQVSQRVLDQVENGSIILLHCGTNTADALPNIIETLKNREYRFVTISQMLAHLPQPPTANR